MDAPPTSPPLPSLLMTGMPPFSAMPSRELSPSGNFKSIVINHGSNQNHAHMHLKASSSSDGLISLHRMPVTPSPTVSPPVGAPMW